MPQKPKFKILVGAPGSQTDITSDFKSANISYAINEFANAGVSVDNKDTKFSTGSVLDPDTPIVISASTDATNFVRLFSGSILTNVNSYAANQPDSVRISCQDDRLRRKTITFNNSVQDNKNFNEIFIGTNTSSGGYSWTADSQGNFPDGLLRNTGFSYNGNITDIYAGVPDLARPFVHGHPKLDEAIQRYMDLFGVDYYTEFTNNKFTTEKRNIFYPTLSDFTLSIGEDINTSALTVNGAEKIKGVLVFGARLPFIYAQGTAPFEFIQDNELESIEAVRERAKTELELKTSNVITGRITVPPETASVLGKRITVNDVDHGWTAAGNVISTAHSITPARWTTDLTFERPQKDVPKLLQEIEDELDDIQTDRDIKHNGYLAFSNTSSDVDTASVVQLTPCCLGIGTLSTTGGVSAQNLVTLLDTVDSAGKDFYFILDDVPITYTFSDQKPLLKEFIVYKNQTGDTIQATKTATINRPQVGFDTSANFHVALTPRVLGISTVEPNRVGYVPYDEGDVRARGDQPDATASKWEDPDTVTASQGEKLSMSWDTESKSDRFFNIVLTRSSSPVDDFDSPSIMWTIPTGLSDDQILDIERIGTTLISRVTYRDNTGGDRNTVIYRIWDNPNPGWTNINFADAGSNLTAWSVLMADDLVPGEHRQWFDGSSIRLNIQPGSSPPPAAGALVTFSIQYFEASIEPHGFNRPRVEHAQQRGPQTLAVRRSIWQPSNPRSGQSGLIGIFSKSDGTGDDLLRGRREKREHDKLGAFAWGATSPQGNNVVTQTRIEATWVQIEANRLNIKAPDSWNALRTRWELATSAPLFVKYKPSSYEGIDVSNLTDGWELERAINGTGNDTFHWNVHSNSDEETLQNKPPYGTTYTISYDDYSDASEYARLRPFPSDANLGFDKNINKTLTIHFYDTLATSSQTGGGDPGGGGGANGDIIAI